MDSFKANTFSARSFISLRSTFTAEGGVEDGKSLDGSNLTFKAIVLPGDKTAEGVLIQALAIPWIEIVRQIQQDPDFLRKLHWRLLEELVAAAYTAAGFDEVILTPRSNDGGRDVIAVKNGFGAIRIIEQVKANNPTNLVTADEVRALLGVVLGDPKASKGVITTTSAFASGIEKDHLIQSHVPFRLELKPKDKLIEWLLSIK
jgi:restriction system protein